jgi:prepilin-type N-terminal cleavage/methylation domain-containing protein
MITLETMIINKKFWSAFSLIELSMVIIILGLLAVGIMGGVNLVKSANSKQLLSEYQDFKTALNNYRLDRSFNKLPGDGTIGDNNGKIEFRNSNGTTECFGAWKDLADENLINHKFI